MKYSSRCSCEKVQLEISLPKPLDTYEPRACDCDFCTARNACYLSDSDGVLDIYQTAQLEQLKQGSKQAIFWQCKYCRDLVAVTHEFSSGLRGAVNASLLSKQHRLPNAIPVSPKNLSLQQKQERWSAIWLKVNFNTH